MLIDLETRRARRATSGCRRECDQRRRARQGTGLGERPERAGAARRSRAVLASFEILPFGVEEAKLYGVLATLVRAAGRNPRPRRLDLQIAATAAAARLPLLTCNPADFVGTERLVDVVEVRRAG